MSKNVVIFNELKKIMSKFFSEHVTSNILFGVTVGSLINDKTFQSKSIIEIKDLSKRILFDLKVMMDREESYLFSDIIKDKNLGLYKTAKSLEKTCLLINNLVNNIEEASIEEKIGFFFENHHKRIIDNLIKNKNKIPKEQLILVNMLEKSHLSQEYNFNIYTLLKNQYTNEMIQKLKGLNNITWRFFRIFVDDQQIYEQLKQLQSFDIKRNFSYFVPHSKEPVT